MLDQLRSKPGNEAVTVHLGDMADMNIDGSFDLIYAVFGTLFMLPTQDGQVRCFRQAAHKLTPHGKLVFEALMPRPTTYEGGKVTVADANDERVIINVSENDALAQTIQTRQVVLSPSGIEIHPVHTRYSWSSELDLTAQLAGLRLHARWSNWKGRPFTAEDQRHIAVYAPPSE